MGDHCSKPSADLNCSAVTSVVVVPDLTHACLPTELGSHARNLPKAHPQRLWIPRLRQRHNRQGDPEPGHVSLSRSSSGGCQPRRLLYVAALHFELVLHESSGLQEIRRRFGQARFVIEQVARQTRDTTNAPSHSRRTNGMKGWSEKVVNLLGVDGHAGVDEFLQDCPQDGIAAFNLP